MSDETESLPSDSDLNIITASRKELGVSKRPTVSRHAKSRPTKAVPKSRNSRLAQAGQQDEESQEQGSGFASKFPKTNRKTEKATIAHSQSSDEESDDGYQPFKPRKQSKRNVEGTSSRKAKAVPGKKRKRKITSSDLEEADKSRDISGDESNSLPDYLKRRRTQFDKRRDQLEQAGLRLPPTYDSNEFSDDEQLESLKEKPDFPNAKPNGPYKDKQLPLSLGLIPAAIAQWLRDYQVTGVAFLHKLFVYQTGGILGDDMGLGKTVQVIAFLTAAFGKTGDERDKKRMRKMRRAGVKWYPRVLIVCPGTLFDNWQDELRRWGWWHVDVYHGEGKDSILQTAIYGRTEVMLTTYTTYRNSQEEINRVEWDCVIADECHCIKGRDSATTKAMNDINALCRIGLTGTAIQNNYEELWTLLNWANPGKLGSLSAWKTHISGPLKMGQSHEASLHQLGKARKTAQALANNLLPQFFLRRMKTLIAHQLPKKSDRIVFCPLTQTQAGAYEAFLESDIVTAIRTSTEPCDCQSGRKSGWCCNTFLPDGTKWQSHVFPAIFYLQKMSNHLAMLIPDSKDNDEKQGKDRHVLEQALPTKWRDLYRTRGSILNYATPEFCGKWRVLKKLVEYWYGNGDKVLVFSHSKKLLKMFRHLFQSTSYNVSYLDGDMSNAERAKEVNDFNADSDQFVFLISTKAGGVGLNITSANKVVILDPNWNPSWDLQAQDRAYRIGQLRDVEVFRLVSAGTIEEIVYARQIYKQQQANIGYTASNERRYFSGIQNNVEQKGELFGLSNLFSYAANNVVLQGIIHKTNVAEARAGVGVVSFDHEFAGEDDDDPLLVGDNEDSAMSQLASIIATENPEPVIKSSTRKRTTEKRSDPVQAILAGAGVTYTHENSEVVGPSKVESHLSRRALEAGNDVEEGGEKLFASQDEGERETRSATGPKWKYRPPIPVMQRHFCSMAKEFGFETPTEFALVVEGWTQAQRRACLDRFYQIRKKTLGLGPTEPDEVV